SRGNHCYLEKLIIRRKWYLPRDRRPRLYRDTPTAPCSIGSFDQVIREVWLENRRSITS
ncbi:8231_t:CDS:2, partial [Acaulospora morrowiae]